MTDRGNFRSIPTVLPDTAEFQALSPGAKLVWYTLKMTLGPSGISIVPSLVGTLMERTGLDSPQVEKGLAQLESAGWFRRERNVAWLVNALREDPFITLDNQNHRTKIAKHANGLPVLAIVEAFRAHYGLAAPPSNIPSLAPETSANLPSKVASKSPSKMASIIPSTNREKGEGKREQGAGTTSAATSATGKKGRAGHPTWLSPFASAWRTKYGGEMSAGVAVKALHKLVEEHGAEEVLRRWVIYLEATAAEYANAPKFASTWGRWAAVIVRPSSPAGTGLPIAPDVARVEAGNHVAAIRELIFDQNIPGQGSKKSLRNADVERMGDDVSRAYRTVGGAARFLKLDTKPEDLPFLIRDFGDALKAARATPSHSDSPPEAQSA